MKSFNTFIYGSVPVYVEIDKAGKIEEIGVTHSKGVYWLDLNDDDRAKFEREFFEVIEGVLG